MIAWSPVHDATEPQNIEVPETTSFAGFYYPWIIISDPRTSAEQLAALTRAQVQQASVTGYDQNAGTYSRQGIEGLQAAGQTWDRYLALDPKNPDAGVAALMVSAYSSGALNDPQQGARALDVVIDARGGSAALYSQLAILHYAAGDIRRSVIAEKQATKRTPERRRKLLKARLAAQR